MLKSIPPEIFKAYDIRGIVGKTLNPDAVEAIGQAVGSESRERGRSTVAIGRDGRLSGPALSAALAAGHIGQQAQKKCKPINNIINCRIVMSLRERRAHMFEAFH